MIVVCLNHYFHIKSIEHENFYSHIKKAITREGTSEEV